MLDIRGHINQCQAEIEEIAERIARLRSNVTSSVQRITDMPLGDGPRDPMADYTIQLLALEEQLCNAQTQLVTYILDFDRMIRKCKDPLIRRAACLKYEDGLTWQQVANRIGGGNTGEAIRKMVVRYFKQL